MFRYVHAQKLQHNRVASLISTPQDIHCCGAVGEKQLVTLLNLVNLALQRIPRTVRDDNGATVLTIIGQTIHLLAEERLMYGILHICNLYLPSCISLLIIIW